MRIAIEIILFAIILAMMGKTTITLHPFSISMEYWHRPVAFILLILAIGLLCTGEYYHGYTKGLENGSGMTIDCIQRYIEDGLK